METLTRNTRLAAVLLAAALGPACEEAAPVVAAPPEVYVADVIQKDVPVYLELVGQTAGSQDVEIRARVEGFLETVNFREGSFVGAGTLLYRIDRKPLEAILAAARADQATAEARLDRADNDVKRTRRSSRNRRSASRSWTTPSPSRTPAVRRSKPRKLPWRIAAVVGRDGDRRRPGLWRHARKVTSSRSTRRPVSRYGASRPARRCGPTRCRSRSRAASTSRWRAATHCSCSG